MTRPSLLVFPFACWAVACVVVGAWILRRAPAVSFALLGSLLGAVGGFAVGRADGPAGVPFTTALGASLGLFVSGTIGLLIARARPPWEPLYRAAWLVLLAAPFAAGALILLLQLACPLYVSGKGTGFCNYKRTDVLGAWVTGVIIVFLLDAVFVAILLWVSAWRSEWSDPRSALRSDRKC